MADIFPFIHKMNLLCCVQCYIHYVKSVNIQIEASIKVMLRRKSVFMPSHSECNVILLLFEELYSTFSVSTEKLCVIQ